MCVLLIIFPYPAVSHVFQGPGFSVFRFLMVEVFQVFQGPSLLWSRFSGSGSWVRVQGPGSGFRVQSPGPGSRVQGPGFGSIVRAQGLGPGYGSSHKYVEHTNRIFS